LFGSKASREKFFASIIAMLGYLTLKLIASTCKKNFILDYELPKHPVIVAIWHGELLMQPFFYLYARPQPKACVMISDYFAGEVIASIVKYFGIDSIRGATNKNGSRMLLQAVKMMRENYDIVITPDGPIGPRYSVADGIVLLAQKTGYPIVCANYDASSKWQIDTWDKFIIPKFFSTVNFTASSPIDISNMSIEEAKLQIYKGLTKHVAE
jgi:lysophospholipid acyltransferase (LPLAT)-like uncharacterized protein